MVDLLSMSDCKLPCCAVLGSGRVLREIRFTVYYYHICQICFSDVSVPIHKHMHTHMPMEYMDVHVHVHVCSVISTMCVCVCV